MSDGQPRVGDCNCDLPSHRLQARRPVFWPQSDGPFQTSGSNSVSRSGGVVGSRRRTDAQTHGTTLKTELNFINIGAEGTVRAAAGRGPGGP
jgi:hypothetical protein